MRRIRAKEISGHKKVLKDIYQPTECYVSLCLGGDRFSLFILILQTNSGNGGDSSSNMWSYLNDLVL